MPRASKEKLMNPALRRHVEWWIASFNVCDSLGIDDHLEMLCQHVRNGSGIFKSDSNRGPKKAWISDRTWGMMCLRSGLKKTLRDASSQMRTIRLVEMFVEWRDVVGSRKQRDLQGGRIWQNVACSQFASACRRWALVSLRLRRFGVQIQRSAKLDRNVMLDRTRIAAEKAGENGDMRKLFKLAKFASGTDAGRLRSVRWEDGAQTQSQKQYLDRFTDHFCEVLGADEFEGPGLPMESETDDDAEILGECPCIEPICKGISRLKNDQGLGFDGIGGELLKAGGFAMASALHKLNAKIWQQKRWPRRWRGGRLQELPKKGDNANVENYRGLLMGDHMGKVSSSILFDDYARAYEQYIPDVQCGAAAGKGTDFASHLLRNVQAYTKTWGKSLGLLFLDLTKAYDRVIRELVFGRFQTGPSDTMRWQRGIAALRKLGLSSAQAHGIAQEIAKGTILTEMGITGASAKLLKSMHSPSWFRMKGAKRKLVVRRGGRQGCLFGSILFNVVYGKALKEFYADCEAHSIPVKVRFSRGGPFKQDQADASAQDERSILDITFVDDEAAMVVTAVPKTMSTKFAFVVNSLRRCFHKYALDINWKAGKTEGILMWRGKRARTEKFKLRKANGRQTFPVGGKKRRHRRKSASDGLDQAVEVGIVKQYKHLGDIIEENGSMFPEVRNRCKSAMNSLAPLGALLRHVSLRRRVHVTHSLIMSKLLYNSQIWEKLEES
ncbi:unnamed protein product [Prorocentrum cordatum]|uniref:Reverse transcriptase domain-containing protein n=1 Tax=Prorocentrum cordatum TaxID=2364126 RepID=A0ABN9UTE2_9DINO|nr:unnamed protein product [Polarella glacialis]